MKHDIEEYLVQFQLVKIIIWIIDFIADISQMIMMGFPVIINCIKKKTQR